MTDFMDHKAADAFVHTSAREMADALKAGDPHTTGATVYPAHMHMTQDMSQYMPKPEPSTGDHIQARVHAEKRIAEAVEHIDRDLDELYTRKATYCVGISGYSIGINEAIGMLTDLKEILTRG